MYRQVPESAWHEVANPVCIATIPLYPSDVAEQFGIHFSEGEEDGLGLSVYAFVEFNGVIAILKALPEGPPETHYLYVWVASYLPDWEPVFNGLSQWGIERGDMPFVQEGLTPGEWRLVRRGLDGVEQELFGFAEEISAYHVRQSYADRDREAEFFVRRRG